MEPMRLNRFLAACGLGSRRQCEALILEGRVTVNRKRCLELATTITASDVVTCQGKELKREATATVLLHKPPGVICTRHDPHDRPTIYDLLPSPLRTLHYVGRLDYESEGLLLLTNDGKLTQHLTHPSHVTEKEYWVVINRPYRPEDTAALKAGMQLDEGYAKADSVQIISPRHVSVIIHQGLNRQIRRMFELLNYEVTRLVRIRIGALDIGQLKPGKWRHLHEPDLEKLRQQSDKPVKAGSTAAKTAPGAKKAVRRNVGGPRKSAYDLPGKSPLGGKKFGDNKFPSKKSAGGKFSPSAGKPVGFSSSAKRPARPSSTSRPAFPSPEEDSRPARPGRSARPAGPAAKRSFSRGAGSAPTGKSRPTKPGRDQGSSRGGAGGKPKRPSTRKGR